MDPFARMYEDLHCARTRSGGSFRKQIAALQQEREQSHASNSRNRSRGEPKAPIWRREVYRREQRDREIRRMQRERDQQELQECTFSPRLSGRSKELAPVGRARLASMVDGQTTKHPLVDRRPRRGSDPLQGERQEAPKAENSSMGGRPSSVLPQQAADSGRQGPARARSAERRHNGTVSPPPPLGPPPPGARQLNQSPSPSGKRPSSRGSRPVPPKDAEDIPGPGERNIPEPAKFITEFPPFSEETAAAHHRRLLQEWDLHWGRRQAELKRLREFLQVEAERLCHVELEHWRSRIRNVHSARSPQNEAQTGSPGGAASTPAEDNVAQLQDRANRSVDTLRVNARRHDAAIESAIEREMDGWRAMRETLAALLSPHTGGVDASHPAYYEEDAPLEKRGRSNTGSSAPDYDSASARTIRERRIAAKSASLAQQRQAIESEAQSQAARDAAELNRVRGSFAREVGLGKRSQASMRQDLEAKERELRDARRQWKEKALQDVAAEETNIVQERLALDGDDTCQSPSRARTRPGSPGSNLPPPPPLSAGSAPAFKGRERAVRSAPSTPSASPARRFSSADAEPVPRLRLRPADGLGGGGHGREQDGRERASPAQPSSRGTAAEKPASPQTTPASRQRSLLPVGPSSHALPSPADMEAARTTIEELRRALHAEQQRSSFIHAEAEQMVAAVRDSAAAEMRSLRAQHTAEINELQLRHERELHSIQEGNRSHSKHDSSIEALTQRVLQQEGQSGVSTRPSRHHSTAMSRDEYAASLDKFSREITSLQEMLDSIVEERNGLEDQLAEANRERDAARSRLLTLEKEREGWRVRMREQAEQLQRLIQDLRENKARLVRSMNDLVAEREELDQERDALLEREDNLYWFAKSHGMEEQWRRSGRSPPGSGGSRDTDRPPRGSVARVRRRSLTELRRNLAAQHQALLHQEEQAADARRAVAAPGEEGGGTS